MCINNLVIYFPQSVYDYRFLSKYFRYAACLPVVALLNEYNPVNDWDPNLEVEEQLRGQHQIRTQLVKTLYVAVSGQRGCNNLSLVILYLNGVISDDLNS